MVSYFSRKSNLVSEIRDSGRQRDEGTTSSREKMRCQLNFNSNFNLNFDLHLDLHLDLNFDLHFDLNLDLNLNNIENDRPSFISPLGFLLCVTLAVLASHLMALHCDCDSCSRSCSQPSAITIADSLHLRSLAKKHISLSLALLLSQRISFSISRPPRIRGLFSELGVHLVVNLCTWHSSSVAFRRARDIWRPPNALPTGLTLITTMAHGG